MSDELLPEYITKFNFSQPVIQQTLSEKQIASKVDNFNNAVSNADYISIHMPLNDKTKNLINMKVLKMMKKNTIIINTARGGVINEKDLDEALNKKIIFVTFGSG